MSDAFEIFAAVEWSMQRSISFLDKYIEYNSSRSLQKTTIWPLAGIRANLENVK